MNIPIFRPNYDQREIDAVSDVIRSGWTGRGKQTDAFESEFSAAMVDGRPTVAVNSGTSALFLALQSLNIGPGDEVIVPAITFASTAHAVLHVGARPVFCDIDPRTNLMDLECLRYCVTDRTTAVIPVHYAGAMVDIEALRGSDHMDHVSIIEDCAHAAGSSLHGKPAGTWGDAAAFSFHAVKNLSCGDGGAVVFQSADRAARARKLAWCGIDKCTAARSRGPAYAWDYSIGEAGWKMHMNDITAAIGRVQLAKLAAANIERDHIAHIYRTQLSKLETRQVCDDGIVFHAIQMLDEVPRCVSSHHIVAVRAALRDGLAAHLAARGIDTGLHYRPLTLHQCYQEYGRLTSTGKRRCAQAEASWRSLITLPCWPGLPKETVYTICSAIEGFYR